MGHSTAVKVAELCAILVAGALCMALPLKLRQQEIAMAMGNMFSAGVLLAASLVHIGPTAEKEMSENLPHVDFPLAGALAGGAFLALYILHMLTLDGPGTNGAYQPDPETGANDAHVQAVGAICNGPRAYEADKTSQGEWQALIRGEPRPICSCNRPGHSCEADIFFLKGRPANLSSVLCFMLSLGFHSVLEGLTMGTDKRSETALFITIILHKAFAAFSFGVVLQQAQGRLVLKVVAALVVILTTPLGIMAGMLWKPVQTSPIIAVLMSMTTGTFLYISLEEVLHSTQETLSSPKGRVMGLAFLVMGFLAMTVLAIWV